MIPLSHKNLYDSHNLEQKKSRSNNSNGSPAEPIERFRELRNFSFIQIKQYCLLQPMCPKRKIKTSICCRSVASLKVEYTSSWTNGQVTIKFVADAAASVFEGVKRFFIRKQKFKRVTNLVIKWPFVLGRGWAGFNLTAVETYVEGC